MKKILISTLLPLLFLIACDKIENPVISKGEGIVIQAYLYANRPVNDIKISTLASFDESSWQKPINNAKVFLYKNNNAFPLTLIPGDSGYYQYEGDDLSINAGDSISISVTHNGITATANTWVPYKPSITYLSKDTLFISQPSHYSGIPEHMFSVEWTSPDSENVYYIYDITPQFKSYWSWRYFSSINSGSYKTFENHWSQTQATMDLFFYSLEDMGKYTFYVHRVNMEYINMVSYRFMLDNKFIKTESNIKNGYGIFTAFNSDSCEIYILASNE